MRIPQDAKKLLDALVQSQSERFRNISNPLDFLDWLTYGILSANRQRGESALDNPSLYNIGNWLTMGFFDTVRGTFDPEGPLSLQHWLDSLAAASAMLAAGEPENAIKPHRRNKRRL